MSETRCEPKKEKKQFKCKRGKHSRRKDKTKVICYNCGNQHHFTHEYIESKRVSSHLSSSKNKLYFLNFYFW